MTKVCIKCGIEKDLEEFTKSDRCVDGHLGICKNCRNEYLRKWRKTEKVEKVEKVEFVIPNSKICKRCGIEKSMEEFYKRYSTKDHHVGVC